MLLYVIIMRQIDQYFILIYIEDLFYLFFLVLQFFTGGAIVLLNWIVISGLIIMCIG